MPRSPSRFRLPHRGALAAALWLAVLPRAHAFAEDVCYVRGPAANNQANCTPLPASCPLNEAAVTSTCLTDALTTFLTQGVNFDPDRPGRSTVHVDATHLMAQVVGFNPASAYWIAAYDEATDLGQFILRDARGTPITSFAPTARIDGVTRTNRTEGGVLFHFHAPRNGGSSAPSASVNGLEPDVHDAHTEVFLAHLRRWALGSGSAPPGCTGGLTTPNPSDPADYATGKGCYVRGDGSPGLINGNIAAIADVALTFRLPTGLQVMQPATDDGVPATTSAQFDSIVTAAGTANPLDARLGLYLHALADRVSHHVCTDAAVLSGPGSSGVFNEQMDNANCVQSWHALRHQWETGVNFSGLDDRNRTTIAALNTLYDELVYFAQARGVLKAGANSTSTRSTVVGLLTNALQISDATKRVDAIAAAACQLQVQPLPGGKNCTQL